jgi:CBS domain-containing membrane protein
MLMSVLRGFLPLQPAVSVVEVIRVGVGSFLGIAIVGALTTWWFGASWETPIVIAPMGAAAVLMFALPESPRIQPFAMVAGSFIAAIVGITCARFIPSALLAVSAAIGLTLVAQLLCRCVHPPGGAVAIVTVLGGPKIHAAGYHFIFMPVMMNTLILLAVGLVFNNLTGRRYPHLPEAPS